GGPDFHRAGAKSRHHPGVGTACRRGRLERFCRDGNRSIPASHCNRGAAARRQGCNFPRTAAGREGGVLGCAGAQQRNIEGSHSGPGRRGKELMLNRAILWSLQNRLVVLALAILLFVFGIRSALQAPLDVFPDFAPPQVMIQTEAPGMSAEETEQLVTVPLET